MGLRADNSRQNIRGLDIYPSDRFSPKNYFTNEIILTDNTVCIHHFDGSWVTGEMRKTAALYKTRNDYVKKYGKLWKLFLIIAHPIVAFKIQKRKKR